MKVLDFIKKKKDETASTGAIKTENSMAVIANLFIQSKKYSLLSDKYNGNVIYFVLGNDTLLYVFILRSMDDYQSKYVLKDNFGKNISIQILFNIDVNEMTEGTPFPTIENWSSIKDFLNTNKIFKTIESSSLARLAFVSMIEGLTFLSQISFSNYKIPITNSQVKQEDEEPEKQVFSETKATTIKKAIASVEEAQNDVDDNIEKKDEVVEDAVVSNESNTDKNESIIKATSEDISRHTFEEISKKVEDMTPKTKTNVSTKYFIGYKIVNSLDSTGKEAWTYELNKDKKPVKLFFAPNNIGKIIASHMFIDVKNFIFVDSSGLLYITSEITFLPNLFVKVPIFGFITSNASSGMSSGVNSMFLSSGRSPLYFWSLIIFKTSSFDSGFLIIVAL